MSYETTFEEHVVGG